jgi:hypothetical protein
VLVKWTSANRLQICEQYRDQFVAALKRVRVPAPHVRQLIGLLTSLHLPARRCPVAGDWTLPGSSYRRDAMPAAERLQRSLGTYVHASESACNVKSSLLRAGELVRDCRRQPCGTHDCDTSEVVRSQSPTLTGT